MSEETKRWIRTLGIALVVFTILSLYLLIRRGYLNLYIANKVFGSTAVILAGITLVLGPLSKKYLNLSSLMTIRRHLGLTAIGFAVLHIIASLIQQNRFPFPKWYLEEWIPVTFGLVAISLWIYLVKISRNSKIREMGVAIWKRNLSVVGRLAFLAIFLHLAVMKYPGWVRWFQGQTRQTPELANPQYPPASLFIFVFMVCVLLYRIINTYLYKRKGVIDMDRHRMAG